jgi:phosphate/phosphite/phosphonate ABC transporter binding protein
VFGLVPAETIEERDGGLNALVRWLGERARVHLVRRKADSYEALERQVRDAAVHVAWLPPVLFLRLEREGFVVPLVANQRHDGPAYVSVLMTRADSPFTTLEGLRGRRVAWVDPLSTTGYIVPRLELAARGYDPRTFFGSEAFHHSHVEAVRALMHGVADAAATYARANVDGSLQRGGWTDAGFSADHLRTLVTSVGLPPDLIAVRADVPLEAQASLASAFVSLGDDLVMRPIVKQLLGVDGFTSGVRGSYEGLRETVDAAASSGMIDAAAAYLSTKPPPRS